MVLQIVSDAELSVDEKKISSIGRGLVAYLCIEKNDKEETLDFFAKKINTLRIFPDENGKTNLSLADINGEVLLVSQFTLAGNFYKGNRPDFTNAESFERAKKMYLKMNDILSETYNINVKLGVFGADMVVKQTGIGPFTAFLEKQE